MATKATMVSALLKGTGFQAGIGLMMVVMGMDSLFQDELRNMLRKDGVDMHFYAIAFLALGCCMIGIMVSRIAKALQLLFDME